MRSNSAAAPATVSGEHMANVPLGEAREGRQMPRPASQETCRHAANSNRRRWGAERLRCKTPFSPRRSARFHKAQHSTTRRCAFALTPFAFEHFELEPPE